MNVGDLWVVFGIGLLGSAHCLGMCGGFVLALGQGEERSGRLQRHFVLYFLGKTVTYAFLGAVVGAGGAVLSAVLFGMQNVLSIVLGLFLIGIGLGLIGVLSRLKGLSSIGGGKLLSKGLAFFLKKKRPSGSFGLGLVNGLLPCGLVYAILARAAAAGSTLEGVLTMAVFGFATIPALYLLGMTGVLMRPVWRSRLNLASGVLVLLLGVMTVLRGTPAIKPVMKWFGGGHDQHEMVDPAATDRTTHVP